MSNSEQAENKEFFNPEIGVPVAYDESGQEIFIEEAEDWNLSEDDVIEILNSVETLEVEDSGGLIEDLKSNIPVISSLTQSSQSRRVPSKERVREDILNLTNQFRNRNKKPPLKLNSKLTDAAQSHSNDMAQMEDMTHTGSDGSKASKRVERVGYRSVYIAENVATNRSAKKVMLAWINSPGHRKNLLKYETNHGGRVTDIGIGFARGRNGKIYWTQVFGAPR